MTSDPVTFHDGRVTLFAGDCTQVLQDLDADSLDACVCDPPYHLTSIVRRFSADGAAAPNSKGATGVYKRSAKGFMGKTWDGGDVAFRPETWSEVYRVLKPGAHLVAFSATRTYHRMACAIEDAGFEIRDMMAWLYGTGFPKSRDISKDIDRMAGVDRAVVQTVKRRDIRNRPGRKRGEGIHASERDHDVEYIDHAITAPTSENAVRWDGWGSALKPALEPVVLARKPIRESSIAAQVLETGTGAINIGSCHIGRTPNDRLEYGVDGDEPSTPGQNVYGDFGERGAYTPNPDGRWPANVLTDGAIPIGDGAERFFYSAKADATSRVGSKHPTVKPVDLMAWLVRLVTPPGGTVLDPFAGTGTTGEAALINGFNAVLIEQDPQSRDDIARRMETVFEPRARRAIAAASRREDDDNPLPLFTENTS